MLNNGSMTSSLNKNALLQTDHIDHGLGGCSVLLTKHFFFLPNQEVQDFRCFVPSVSMLPTYKLWQKYHRHVPGIARPAQRRCCTVNKVSETSVSGNKVSETRVPLQLEQSEILVLK